MAKKYRVDSYAAAATKVLAPLVAKGRDWRRSDECRGLATHCAACGKKLSDALSVQVLVGPDCREACGYDPERTPAAPDWYAAQTIAANNGVADDAVTNWRDAREVCNFLLHVYALAAEVNPWVPDAVGALGYAGLAKRLVERRDEFIARAKDRAEKEAAEAAKREAAAKRRARRWGRVYTGAKAKPAPVVRITEAAGRIAVETPYNERFVIAVRGIEGRRWNAATKVWTVPASARPALWAAIKSHYAGATLVSDKGTTVIPAA